MKKLYCFIAVMLLCAFVAYADNYEIHDQGVLIPDDYYLIFGTDSNFYLRYDETTDNALELSDGTNTFLSVTDDGATATFAITGDLGITGNMSATTYGSNGTVSNAELLYINSLSSNAQTQLDARCLESVFGISLGDGLALDGTALTVDGVLEDLDTLGTVASDGQFIVATGAGAFAYESGNTARTSLGLGTGDSPQFTGIELGAATDTTLIRTGAGDVSIEGKAIYRADGTDVADADVVDDITVTSTKKISTLLTTEQLRLSYDALNYATWTVAADGALTLTTVDNVAAEADINFNPDGFVGVKTAVPTVELDVTGAIKASGTISAATYGSDGSVLNAELLYINTLSSNAQTQLNAKAPLASPSFTAGIGIGGAAAQTGGIAFPATAVPSADPNTLDDYEEGTWTPSVGGDATYHSQLGDYVKIGKTVFIWCQFQINVLGTGSTTTISGLPFTVGTQGDRQGGSVSYLAASAINVIYIAVQLTKTATTCTFNYSAAAGASLSIDGAIFGNSARVDFSSSYII